MPFTEAAKTPVEESEPLIFMSYASQDLDRVLPFYDGLLGRYPNLWLDRKQILGGQNWDFEIRKALDKASIVVVFLSNNSVSKRGYVQREIKIAIDKLQERLPGDIYIIPVLLDSDCTIPPELAKIQALDANESQIIDRLLKAIDSQTAEVTARTTHTQEESGVHWRKRVVTENWEGVPGYDIKYDLISFSSSEHPKIGDVSAVIHGFLAGEVALWRQEKLNQNRDRFHFTDSRPARTSIYEASYEEPVIVGRVLSIQYNVYWFGAGAAHGNMHVETFVFLLDPLVWVKNIENAFREPDVVFPLLQSVIREALIEQMKTRIDEMDEFVQDSIELGTGSWTDLRDFIFTETGIRFTFPPYQVAAYVFGTFTVLVEYKNVYKYMHAYFLRALDLYEWQFEDPQWGLPGDQP
jgi:hypothetical protein